MDLDALDTLYCRVIDCVVNRRRLGELDQFLAREVVEHTPVETVGIDSARQTLSRILTACPDLHMVIGDVVVDSDRVMARLTATGTYSGSVGDALPAGRVMRIPIFEAWSVREGRCVERWLQPDRYGFAPLLDRETSDPTNSSRGS
jgi:predicted ester cyclase